MNDIMLFIIACIMVFCVLGYIVHEYSYQKYCNKVKLILDNCSPKEFFHIRMVYHHGITREGYRNSNTPFKTANEIHMCYLGRYLNHDNNVSD